MGSAKQTSDQGTKGLSFEFKAEALRNSPFGVSIQMIRSGIGVGGNEMNERTLGRGSACPASKSAVESERSVATEAPGGLASSF